MQHPLGLCDVDVQALGDGEAVVRDGFLPIAEVVACALHLDQLDADRALSSAGVGRLGILDPMVRGDRTTWLEPALGAPLQGMSARFEAVRLELNQACWLGLRQAAIQLAVYPADGARYARHRDALAGDPSRRATAIVYLNPAWEPAHGGQLRIHPPRGPIDIEPVGGRMVLFLSDRLDHEVLPSHHVRRAATAWFRGP